jgi:hypothetical protein
LCWMLVNGTLFSFCWRNVIFHCLLKMCLMFVDVVWCLLFFVDVCWFFEV